MVWVLQEPQSFLPFWVGGSRVTAYCHPEVGQMSGGPSSVCSSPFVLGQITSISVGPSRPLFAHLSNREGVCIHGSQRCHPR